MRKRFFSCLIAATLCLTFLSGCGEDSADLSQAESSPFSSAGSETETSGDSSKFTEESSQPSQNPMVPSSPAQEEVETLLEKNFYLVDQVFYTNTLPVEKDLEDLPEGSDLVQKVKSEKFPDYETFEDYVRSVYSKKTADLYLYAYPYEGDPKYLNRDGKLYVNLKHSGGKGYFVDLEHYKVTMGNRDGDFYDFTVETTVTEPAEKPEKEPYFMKGKVRYENGRWVLDRMLF